jgi:hypothetical protein
MRYLLGARGAELEQGFEHASFGRAGELLRQLGVADRRQRAEALKHPLRELMAALDEREISGGRRS